MNEETFQLIKDARLAHQFSVSKRNRQEALVDFIINTYTMAAGLKSILDGMRHRASYSNSNLDDLTHRADYLEKRITDHMRETLGIVFPVKPAPTVPTPPVPMTTAPLPAFPHGDII